jgi:hypothetical protein
MTRASTTDDPRRGLRAREAVFRQKRAEIRVVESEIQRERRSSGESTHVQSLDAIASDGSNLAKSTLRRTRWSARDAARCPRTTSRTRSHACGVGSAG